MAKCASAASSLNPRGPRSARASRPRPRQPRRIRGSPCPPRAADAHLPDMIARRAFSRLSKSAGTTRTGRVEVSQFGLRICGLRLSQLRAHQSAIRNPQFTHGRRKPPRRDQDDDGREPDAQSDEGRNPRDAPLLEPEGWARFIDASNWSSAGEALRREGPNSEAAKKALATVNSLHDYVSRTGRRRGLGVRREAKRHALSSARCGCGRRGSFVCEVGGISLRRRVALRFHRTSISRWPISTPILERALLRFTHHHLPSRRFLAVRLKTSRGSCARFGLAGPPPARRTA